LWDQQILLLWILLAPVFFGGALLVIAAPLLFRDQDTQSADDDCPADQAVHVANAAERKAA